MIDVNTAAQAMLRLIETGKADITLPLAASLGAKLLHLFPNVLVGIAGKLLNKK